MAAQAGVSVAVIVSTEGEAERLATDVAFFLGGRARAPSDVDGAVVVLPELDTSPLGDLATDALVAATRFAVFARLPAPIRRR